MPARFYLLAIGELNPDFLSGRIQSYLTRKHGVDVDWSHIALLVEGYGDRGDGVWDHTGRGFERCSLEEALDNGGAVARRKIELRVRNAAEAVGWLRGKRGSWYANLQYALYVLPIPVARLLGKLLPTYIRKQFANGRALGVCSETIGYFIQDNCEGAEDHPLLMDGDRLDPFMAVIAGQEFEVQADGG